jgi:hypothetical protein
VSLFRRRNRATRAHGDQSALRDRRRLPAVIHDLQQQAAEAGTALQLQPVVQFCGAVRYPSWARGWQSAWQRAGVRDAKVAWPDAIPVDHTAALLIPVLPGRVGLAIGKHPIPQVIPLLAHAHLPADVDAADFALNLVLQWIDTRPPGQPIELAPPVLEYATTGRVDRRQLETYGQRWPLPAPDGI